MDHSSPLRNHIPSGRQIPRTPPLKDSNPFDVEEKQHVKVGLLNNEELDVKTEAEWSMLKDMKGYQMTADDLDFITKFKSEQRVKKLKADLEDVQKLLKKETMALEMSWASLEKVQAELNKLPACEDIITYVKVVLDVTEMQDDRSLLDMVTMENIRNVMQEKKTRLTQMRKMEEKRKKKEAKERGEMEKRITNEQVKIQELMRDLSDLKSELEQQKEVNKSNKKLLSTKEAQSEGDKSKRRGRKKAEPGTSKNTRRKEEETVRQEETAPAVRGRRKAVAPVEEPAGLRRSKRIASRK